jgi:hypothetical protein
VVRRQEVQEQKRRPFPPGSLSPEGRTLKQALNGKNPKEKSAVGQKEMQEIYDTYPLTGSRLEIVALCFC